MSITHEEIAKTIKEAQDEIIPSNSQLDFALDNSAAKDIPPIAIGPAQGQFLSILCKSIEAKNILEVGTLGGYSTLFFASSVAGVQVTTLELREHHRDVALENLKGVDNVTSLLGPALDLLPRLAEEGKVFDFVFIDADNANQDKYFDWGVRLARPGGLIYVDNAIRRITDWARDEPKRMNLIDQVKRDKRVRASLIPTLNYGSVYRQDETELEKQIDGFLIATKL